MIPILPDATLTASRHDLGLRLVDGSLHAPADVAALLHRLGVHDASLVLAAFDEMPSAFIAALQIPVDELPVVRGRLAQSLAGVECPGGDPEFRQPPPGVFPPR